MKHIALFASGTGSNVLNLLERAAHLPNLNIPCVIVDTEHSPLPEVLGQKYPEIKTLRVLPDPHLRGAPKKDEHEGRILQHLVELKIDWIFLAGYMRLIGPRLLGEYSERIVNIHPSLLPLYPGLNAYERAYEDKVEYSGVTIHLVDAGMDTGPILFQKSFQRAQGDTLADFIQKGKNLEWELYPKMLHKLSELNL